MDEYRLRYLGSDVLISSENAAASLAVYWNEDSVSENMSGDNNVEALVVLSRRDFTPLLAP